MSSPSPDDPERAAFLDAAAQIGAAFDSLTPDFFAEPWPDWFTEIVSRFCGVFMPQLRLDDFQNNPVEFFGRATALQLEMTKILTGLDWSKYFEQGDAERLAELSPALIEAERANIKEIQARAMDLSVDQSLTFLGAQGKSVENEGSTKALMRCETSITLKVCYFLMSNRRVVENREVATVGELFGRFYEWIGKGDAVAETFYKTNTNVHASMKAQFQKICSECGVRLSTRGRPRANLD